MHHLEVRIRGTLEDIDPLNKPEVGFKKGPL